MSGADDVSMLGMGIDASESRTGSQVYSRSIDDIKAKSAEGVAATGRIRASFGGLSETIRETATTIAGFIGVEQIIKYADEWTHVSNELRQVTSSGAELAAVERELFTIAQESRGTLVGTVEQYERYAE